VSTILKALRQLERERPDASSLAGEDANAEFAGEKRRASRGAGAATWLGFGLGAIGTGLIAFALVTMRGSERADAPPAVADARSPSGDAARAPAALPAPAQAMAVRAAAEGAAPAPVERATAAQPELPALVAPAAGVDPVAPAVPVDPVAAVDPVTSPAPVPAAVAAQQQPAPVEIAAPERASDFRAPADAPPPGVPRAKPRVARRAEPEAPPAAAPSPTRQAASPPPIPETAAPPPPAVAVAKAPAPDPPVDVAVVSVPAALEPPLHRPVRTTWHPSADRRSARLEAPTGSARDVREGDEVDGYEVVEITPSSVVFGRGGDTVRVRIGAR